MKKNNSLRSQCTTFASQRGLQLASIPKDWRQKPNMMVMVNKFADVNERRLRVRQNNKPCYLSGSEDYLIKYLSPQTKIEKRVENDKNIVRKMWFVIGTVNYMTTSSRISDGEDYSGPLLHVLGAVIGYREGSTAHLQTVVIFNSALQKYMNGWSQVLHREPPNMTMIKQMRSEIIRLMSLRYAVSFMDCRSTKFFKNSSTFRIMLQESKLSKKEDITVTQMKLIVQNILDDNQQDIVDRMVCSVDVDEPTYAEGGVVHMPTSSEFCTANLNRKAFTSGKLFQEYLSHQMSEETTPSPSPKQLPVTTPLYDESKEDSSEDTEDDLDFGSTTSMQLAIPKSERKHVTPSAFTPDNARKLLNEYSDDDDDTSSSSSSSDDDDDNQTRRGGNKRRFLTKKQIAQMIKTATKNIKREIQI